MNHEPSLRSNPFPGLRPFESDEDYLFFGREAQTERLLALLREHRFLAVVGASGSGKSSLVRAGLLPGLHGGTMAAAGSSWEVVVLRPGGDPLRNLAGALLDAELYDGEDADSLHRVLATLTRSSSGLVEAVRQSDLAEQTNLLVVVDQFEELFRFRRSGVAGEEAAAAFVKLLLNAVRQTDLPLYVTITMRSDYLGDCAQIPDLAEAVNDGEYLIPRLRRDQRREAIERPVAVGGGRISPRLVQRLLNDVGDDDDQLPVLQHALMRMWDCWVADHEEGEPIDLRHCDQVGGLWQALSIHADEVYAGLGEPRLQTVARRMFQALTERGVDNRGIRRPTRLDRLCEITGAPEAEVRAVAEAFRRPGCTFLMPQVKVALTSDTVLDISHESLMRNWEQLRRWVEEEFQSARIYARLAETAALYAEGKAAHYHDPDLQVALSWRDAEEPNAAWGARYHDGFDAAMAFLDASLRERQQAEERREAARQKELEQARRLAEAERMRAEEQQRSARRMKGFMAAIGVAAVLAVVALFFALGARREAEENARLARDNARQAAASEERALASEQVAIEQAARVEEQAERNRRNLYASAVQLAARTWQDPEGQASGLEQMLAAWASGGGGEDDLREFSWRLLWEEFTGAAAISIPTRARSFAFDSAGNLITSDLWGLHRWDLTATPPTSTPLPIAEDVLRSVQAGMVKMSRVIQEAFGARQESLAGGTWELAPSADRAVARTETGLVILDVKTGESVCEIQMSDTVASMRFTADAAFLATLEVGDPYTGHLWDARTGRMVHRYDVTSSDLVRDSRVSSDGRSLLVAGHYVHFEFTLYPVLDQGIPIPCTAPRSTVYAVALSPDDRVAAGGDSNGQVTLMDTVTGAVRTLKAHSHPVQALQFSADGRHLAVGSDQGLVTILAVEEGVEVARLKGHTDRVRELAFFDNDHRLASMSDDGFLNIWDLRESSPGLRSAGREFHRIAYAPDGRWLAVTSDDATLLWNLDDSTLRQVPVNAFGLAFSPDSRTLTVGASNGGIHFIDLETGATHGGWSVEVMSCALAYSPDGRYLAAGLGYPNNQSGQFPSPVNLWDVESERELPPLIGHQGKVVAVAFSPDGAWLASGSHDRTVRIWSVASWECVQDLDVGDRVTSIAFSSDGRRLLAGIGSGPIRIWDRESGQIVANLQGHTNQVAALSISPDGKTLASAGWDNTVKLWDLRSGVEVRSLRDHDDWVTGVAFSPEGNTLTSASVDRTVRSRRAAARDEVDRDPALLRALSRTANRRLEEGAAARAADLLERVLGRQREVLGTEHSHTLDTLLELARSRARADQHRPSASAFREHLELLRDPLLDRHAAVALDQADLAREELRCGDVSEAEELLRQATVALPENEEITQLLAEVCIAKWTPDSVAEAEALLLSQKDHDESVPTLAGLYRRLGRAAEAAEWEGRTAARKGDWKAALASLDRSIELDPRRGSAYAQRADIYRKRGDWELSAADYLRFASSDDPDPDAEVWYEGATTIAQVRDLEAYDEYRFLMLERFRDTKDKLALEWAARGALIFPGDELELSLASLLAELAVAAATEPVEEAWASVSLALAEYRTEEFEAAAATCRKILAFDANWTQSMLAYLISAGAYHGSGEREIARAQMRRVENLLQDRETLPTEPNGIVIECLYEEISELLAR